MMQESEPFIISISREYGTGGHEIADLIAKEYAIHLYDRNILDEISERMNIDIETLHPSDERPRNVFMSRRVRDHSNSWEENVAKMQFDFIREKAQEGKPFVIVGRCAETVLAGEKHLISVFITGDIDARIKRIMQIYKLTEKEALNKIARHDRYRKQYHNAHSGFRWGNSKHYDLCINSSRIGVGGAVKVIRTMTDAILQGG